MTNKKLERKINFIYGFIWTILIGIIIISVVGFIYYFGFYTEKVTTVSKIILNDANYMASYDKEDKIICEDGVIIWKYSREVSINYLGCNVQFVQEYYSRYYWNNNYIRMSEEEQIAKQEESVKNYKNCLAKNYKVCLVTHTERKV